MLFYQKQIFYARVKELHLPAEEWRPVKKTKKKNSTSFEIR